MQLKTLYEKDYFSNETDMHYAHLYSVEKIAPQLHKHEFFEIFLITQGQLVHIVNNKRSIIEEGVLTFIRPDDAHYFRPVPKTPCSMINLAIAKRALYALLNYLGDGFDSKALMTSELPPSVMLRQSVKAQLQVKLEHLSSLPITNALARNTFLRILLFELITQYFPITIHKQDKRLPRWLELSCSAMKEPETMRLGVSKMLSLSKVSAEHLARSCKKYLGQTPTQYINDLRLNYAANLLAYGDKSIINIAAEVGFESLSYFYSSFKKAFYMTPKQFRLKHQMHLA